MVVIQGNGNEHGISQRHTYGSDRGPLVVIECECGERTTPYPLDLVALAEEEMYAHFQAVKPDRPAQYGAA